MSCAGESGSSQPGGNIEGMRGIISAVVAGLAGCDVAEGTPLAQAGLDSLAFVELRSELARYLPASRHFLIFFVSIDRP